MEITIDIIRALADQNLLKTKLKPDDSFTVSKDVKSEVEQILRNEKIGYQGITQPSNNVLFIIQHYGDQG